jgi:hypothetical protein
MVEPSDGPVDFVEHLCAALGIGRTAASELLIEYMQRLERRRQRMSPIVDTPKSPHHGHPRHPVGH